MTMSEDETQFIDADSYSGGGKQEVTFPAIVMRHIIRLGGLASQEFRGGYWEKHPRMIGGSTYSDEHYIGDSREEYGNSIDFLHDILHEYFDSTMQKASLQDGKELEIAKEQATSTNEQGVKTIDKQTYKNKKIQIKRKLFRALMGFLKREKYLQGKTFEEDV